MLAVVTYARLQPGAEDDDASLVRLLTSLGAHCANCDACAAALRLFVHLFAQKVDAFLSSDSCQPYNLIADKVELQEDKKRKGVRMDTDFVHKAIRTDVSAGHTHSGRELCRVLAGGVSTVDGWVEKDLCQQLAAARRVFKSEAVRTVCFAEDGKRLGDNKRENILFEMWSPNVDTGMYLLPQD